MPDIAVTTAAAAPAGGLAGQVLLKSSGADYDTTWVSPANVTGAGVVYASQQWYDNRTSASPNSGGMALTGGSGYYLPYYSATGVTIDMMGVYCPPGTATATTIRVGVLTATGSTYQPGAIIASTTLTTTASGGAFTAALAATIPAGWSFLGIAATAAVTITGAGSATAWPWPATTPGTLTITDQLQQYLVTASGGLVANPATTTNTVVGTPLVYFRAA